MTAEAVFKSTFVTFTMK